MTAGHNALRGIVFLRQARILQTASGICGLSDFVIQLALHYVLFALPTFTSRRITGVIPLSVTVVSATGSS